MRIDKFLKVSRILKRRTVAQEACSEEKVLINGKSAKPSTAVKIGDIVEVLYASGSLKFRILNIKETVKNAAFRQSNTYFSSSEGDFKDRYDFRDNFDRLRNGEIEAKGGWRIYSSGPGIYLSRLLRDMLGIRVGNSSVTIDPAIAPDWNGLSCKYSLWDKEYVFIYHIKEKGCGVCSVKAGEQELTNTGEGAVYRPSGMTIERTWLESLETNQIDIYVF